MTRNKVEIGNRYNFLTVLSETGTSNSTGKLWNCVCDCGNVIQTPTTTLLKGSRYSCGCKTGTSYVPISYNNSITTNPAYKPWAMMKQRCYNPNYTHYMYYGGLGITVYQPWIDSFEEFFTYVGPRPDGYTLDRIDSTLGYYPGNVRWASRATQVYNRDYTRLYNVYGTELNLREIANLFVVDFIALSNAINYGWDLMLWISIQLEYEFIEPLDQ